MVSMVPVIFQLMFVSLNFWAFHFLRFRISKLLLKIILKIIFCIEIKIVMNALQSWLNKKEIQILWWHKLCFYLEINSYLDKRGLIERRESTLQTGSPGSPDRSVCHWKCSESVMHYEQNKKIKHYFCCGIFEKKILLF